MKQAIIFIAICFGVIPQSSAFAVEFDNDSSSSPNIHFDLINQEDGLSQGMISKMVTDQYGYLWIATKDGLNRYDGKNFKIYRPDPKRKNSLEDGYISALLFDSKNRLWVGTQSSGLYLYDEDSDGFTKFNEKGENVSRIIELNNGTILVEHNRGKNFSVLFHNKANKEGSEQLISLRARDSNWSDFMDSCYDISAISFQKNKKTLWIIDSRTNTYQLKINDSVAISNIKKFAFGDLQFQIERESKYKAIVVKNFSQNGRFFISYSDDELHVYNEKVDHFRKVLSLPKGLAINGYSFIDRSNNLWVFQKNGSILLHNLTTNSSQIVTPRNDDIVKVLMNQSYFNIHEDRYHNIFIGTTGKGIVKAHDYSAFFKEVKLNGKPTTDLNFRLVGKETTKLFDLESQKALNAVQESSVYRNLYRRDLGGFQSRDLALADSLFYIQAIKKNSKLHLILKVVKGGIIRAIKMKKAYNSIDLGAYFIFSDNKDNIWFVSQAGTAAGKLNQLNADDSSFTDFDLPGEWVAQEYPYVSDLLVDENNLFWFATIDGIQVFNPAVKKWKTIELKPASPATEPTGEAKRTNVKMRFWSILADPIQPQKYVWCGTDGYGFMRLNKKSGDYKLFSEEDGLSNNVVYGILNDSMNNLWLSTNNGISLFNLKKQEFRNFTKGDGLNINEFDRYKYSKDRDGNLYFGGEQKVLKVKPKAFYNGRSASEVIINELKIQNRTIDMASPNFEKFELKQPISKTQELKFPYNFQMITLGFTMLNLSNPEQNKYQYMLEGFNENWLEAGAEQEAIYTNLSPGDYKFKVRGFNSQDVWSQPTELLIVILPPWWQTWWFITFSVLSVSLILFSIYKYRLNQILKEERMRNDIAQDLHDEIGSSLSSISLYSAVLQKTTEDLPKKSVDLLTKIIESTSSVMGSMNDMVWAIKADNDTFEKVVNRLRSYSVNMTESKNIELHFKVNQAAEELNLTMSDRKNVYLIFKEAINNAIKYSGANELEVEILARNNSLTISVSDNGRGFSYDKEVAKNNLMGGNGIEGMHYRAKKINGNLTIYSSPSDGTSIVLNMQL